MNINFLTRNVITNSNFIDRFADSVLLAPYHYRVETFRGLNAIGHFKVDLASKRVHEIIRRPKPVDYLLVQSMKIVIATLIDLPCRIVAIVLKCLLHLSHSIRERRQLLSSWYSEKSKKSEKIDLNLIFQQKTIEGEKREKILNLIVPSPAELERKVHKDMTPPLVLIFSKYLIAKDVAKASRTCRNWHYTVTKKLYWDNTWKKAYPKEVQLGYKILRWHPKRTVEQMKTIQLEINQIQLDAVEAFGGQAGIDSLPLINQAPPINNFFDLTPAVLGANTMIRYKQKDAIRIFILKVSPNDRDQFNTRGTTPELFDKTVQILERLNSIWKEKEQLIDENPLMCNMHLLDFGGFHVLDLPKQT